MLQAVTRTMHSRQGQVALGHVEMAGLSVRLVGEVAATPIRHPTPSPRELTEEGASAVPSSAPRALPSHPPLMPPSSHPAIVPDRTPRAHQEFVPRGAVRICHYHQAMHICAPPGYSCLFLVPICAPACPDAVPPAPMIQPRLCVAAGDAAAAQ